jgi:hypothetical protein
MHYLNKQIINVLNVKLGVKTLSFLITKKHINECVFAKLNIKNHEIATLQYTYMFDITILLI